MDIVYFVKDTERNEELRYSLRSIEWNFPHRYVWFIGGKPDALNPDIYLPVPQTAKTKWGNTNLLMKAACSCGEISDSFVLFNDDFFIMNPVESLPYYTNGLLADRIYELLCQRPNASAYTKRLQAMKAMLEERGYPTVNYDLHFPMVISKSEMIETFIEFPGGEMWRSLYGNHHKKPCVQTDDCKVYRMDRVPPDDTRFISTTDAVFQFGSVGAYIRQRFPEPSRFEVRT